MQGELLSPPLLRIVWSRINTVTPPTHTHIDILFPWLPSQQLIHRHVKKTRHNLLNANSTTTLWKRPKPQFTTISTSQKGKVCFACMLFKKKTRQRKLCFVRSGTHGFEKKERKKQEFFFIDNKRAPKPAGFRHSASW